MKTILVVYSHERLTPSEAQSKKRYPFNVNKNVKVGDRLDCDAYTTPLQVVEVFATPFEFVNIQTGQLSNKKEANTNQVPIRTLRINTDYEHDADTSFNTRRL